MQAAYRRRVQADAHLFHSLTSREALEAGVLKLRDDLTKLRRGVKQWALGVAILLMVSVALGFWLLHGQRETTQEMRETKKALTEMASEMAKLRQGLSEYPQVEAQVSNRKRMRIPLSCKSGFTRSSARRWASTTKFCGARCRRG